MKRVAAYDCGTNTLRLLVADVGAGGALQDVERQMQVVRLGEGVDRTGRLSDHALARAFATTQQYAARCRELGVTKSRFVATSATRDAANRVDFVTGIQDILGIVPEVITGTEEAALSFHGATGSLAAQGVAGPFLVVDIGGGSTEVIRGEHEVEASCSIDLGCVRVTERFFTGDPPGPAEVAAATSVIEAQLDLVSAQVDLRGVRQVIGLAGSTLSVAAAALNLSAYDPTQIHQANLPTPAVLAAADRLLAMPLAERLELPWMHPGRADVVGAGALIWRLLLARIHQVSPVPTIMTSEHDILDGIAISLAR